MNDRQALLNQWANSIVSAARVGALDKGKPLGLRGVDTICGPRAGALEIDAGLDAGRLYSVLSASDFALHRQFVPWQFGGEPSVYLVSRYVRLEAAWSSEMAERDIPLSTLSQKPHGGGRWVAGKNELGATIVVGVSDAMPHYLIGGWTGSGKTLFFRSSLAQLSQDPDNQLVLVDGKPFGAGLGCLGHLPGLVGPVASDVESARQALSWAVGEMRRRYEQGESRGRLIVAVDEVQELTGGETGDDAVTEMVSQLVRLGREVHVHVLLGTQHPTLAALSDSKIKRNLPGRIALRTEDYKASEVVVGGPTPRADRLCGAGDAYIVTPNAVHRTQLCYIPRAELPKYSTGQPQMAAWPEYDPQAAGSLRNEKTTGWQYSGSELAVSIVAAHRDHGRPALIKALETHGLPKPGNDRATRLLHLGREAYQWLADHEWQLTNQ